MQLNPKFNPQKRISYKNHPYVGPGSTKMMLDYESLCNSAKHSADSQRVLDEFHEALYRNFPNTQLSTKQKAGILGSSFLAGLIFGYKS